MFSKNIRMIIANVRKYRLIVRFLYYHLRTADLSLRTTVSMTIVNGSDRTSL